MVKFMDRLFHAAIAAALTFLFAFSAGLCGWMYYRGWWATFYPTGSDISNPVGVPLIVYQISAPHLITASAEAWIANHTADQALTYTHDVLVVLAASMLFAALVAIGAWRQAAEKPAQRHLRGRKLLTGKAATQAARQPAWRRFVWWWCEPPAWPPFLIPLGRRFAGRPGVWIHPAVQILYRTEVEHFLAVGKTRAGKTVITTPVILAAIERGDLTVIADIKNDYSEIVPAEVPILGVDHGTHMWDMARDIRTAEHAKEFAQRIVPAPADDKNRYFYEAAQDVVRAAVIYTMTRRGEKWTIFHLAELLAADKDTLIDMLRDPRVDRYVPRVADHVAGDRDAASDVLGNINTATQSIHDLVNAWGGRGLEQWSVTGWLAGEHPAPVVLAGSATLPKLAETLFRLVLPVAASSVLALPDSRDRRIWFFVDELPAFGRLEPIKRLLERGGSKGAAVWLAFQDFSQLEETYGHAGARTILANLNTWIVCQIAEVETQRYLAQAIDERSVTRTTESHSTPGAGGGGSQSESEHEQKEWAMAPHEFRDLLYADPDHKTVRALLHWSRLVGVLNWPMRSYPTVRKIEQWPERPISAANPDKPARRTRDPEPLPPSPQAEPEPAEPPASDPLTRAREAARKLANAGND